MNKALLTVAFLAATFTLPLPSWAEGGGGGGGKGGKTATPTVDLNEVASVLQLKDAQRQQWDKAVEDKRVRLEEFDNANKTAVDNAQKGLSDPKRKAQAQRFLDKVKADLEALEVSLNNKVFATLTTEQQVLWTSTKLQHIVMSEFAALGLMPDQEQKIKSICDAAASRSPCLYVESNQALIKSVKQDVFNNVLTQEQRNSYTKLQQQVNQPKNKGGAKGGAKGGGGGG